jgi:hypothetical protein
VKTTRTGLAPPTRQYAELVGRDDELDDVRGILDRAGRRPLILIDGWPGIGKTALAQETVTRTLEDGLFERCFWVPIASHRFDGTRARRVAPPGSNLSDIIARLGETLDIASEIRGRDLVEQARRVRDALDELIADFEYYQLMNRGAAILTSRRKSTTTTLCRSVPLRKLSLPASIRLLTEQLRGLDQPKPSEQELRRIHELTDGVPLMMRVITGQIATKATPLGELLTRWSAAPKAKTQKATYDFMYRQAWDDLSDPCRRVLIVLSRFRSESPRFAHELHEKTGMSKEEGEQALDDLCLANLMEKGGTLEHPTFSLHPTQRAFVRGLIDDLPRDD